MKLPNRSAFTLLELLLCVTIISILGALSIPVYRTLLTKNDLDVASAISAQSLRRAQTLSQAVDGDSQWGVKVQTGSIIVFKGTTYSGRDSTYDETYPISGSITMSGVNEVVYSKLYGVPSATGSMSLTNGSDSRNITINSKGMVSY